MANNDLAVRFTENKYATKSEVGKELKMSLIDGIWNGILNYRSNFNRYLIIKSIEKKQLVVCFCPTISALASAVDMKLIRVLKEYSMLNATNGEMKLFEDECYIKSLSALAVKHDLDISEPYLRSLVHGDIREVSPSHILLARYLESLHYIKKAYVNNVDEDFLANLYSTLTGNSELTSFYRSAEDSSRENKVLIDPIYTSAPVGSIEGMMDSLFSFIGNSSLSAATKAVIAYYYVSYIKPFSKYSDEIALLIAKAILAHSDLGEMGALLPLESLLSSEQEEIAKIFIEVQRTCDTTYFVNYGLKFIEHKCDELLDYASNLKANALKKDFYKEEIKEQTAVPEAKEEQPSLFVEEKNDEPVKVEPIEEEHKVSEQPKVETPVVEAVKVVEKPKEEIAVSYIPPAIDEKEAYRLEQHLLELDPSLRRHEAHFYARHCTLGKSYTIAQYKRATGCVYETARSAMDHLVSLGYYRKDSSNKKFIYTPIPRK